MELLKFFYLFSSLKMKITILLCPKSLHHNNSLNSTKKEYYFKKQMLQNELYLHSKLLLFYYMDFDDEDPKTFMEFILKCLND